MYKVNLQVFSKMSKYNFFKRLFRKMTIEQLRSYILDISFSFFTAFDIFVSSVSLFLFLSPFISFFHFSLHIIHLLRSNSLFVIVVYRYVLLLHSLSLSLSFLSRLVFTLASPPPKYTGVEVTFNQVCAGLCKLDREQHFRGQHRNKSNNKRRIF